MSPAVSTQTILASHLNPLYLIPLCTYSSRIHVIHPMQTRSMSGSFMPKIHPTLFSLLRNHNPVMHSRTKHIELDVIFVREKVLAKSLSIPHILTHEQVADILTKAFFKQRFSGWPSKLGVFSPSATPWIYRGNVRDICLSVTHLCYMCSVISNSVQCITFSLAVSCI